MKKNSNDTLPNSVSLIDTIKPIIHTLTITQNSITDASSLTGATELLSKCNKYLDALTKDKEALTKPLNETLKGIRAKYKPTEDMLNESIASIRKEMTRYQTALIEKQRKEQEKIAERVAKGTLKMETGLKKLESMPVVANKTTTEEGSVKFREVECFEVVDITKLQQEYILPNETAIRVAMKAGIKVDGVRYYKEMVPVNSR